VREERDDLRQRLDAAQAQVLALTQRLAAEESSAVVEDLRRRLEEAEVRIKELATAAPPPAPAETAEEAGVVVDALRDRHEEARGPIRALAPSAPRTPPERPSEPSAGITLAGPLRGFLARLLGW
jgi:hypothetical protein